MPRPAAPSQDDYRVRLDRFEGPLDLLLFLIRRAEVDVEDIPVALIADQYLGLLGQLDTAGGRIDVDQAGEFLVMAATLMEIKSRMIARRHAAEDDESADREGGAGEDDPRSDLVQQLLAYRRYRDLAERLEDRRREWEQRFPVGRAAADGAALGEATDELAERLAAVELEDLQLQDLVEAFERILASVDLDRVGEHEVVADDTPLELHAEDILDRLRRADTAASGDRGGLSLRGVFAGRTRSEMIGLFLALLDLVRQDRVTFRQDQSEDGATADITIRLRDGTADQQNADAAPAGG